MRELRADTSLAAGAELLIVRPPELLVRLVDAVIGWRHPRAMFILALVIPLVLLAVADWRMRRRS